MSAIEGLPDDFRDLLVALADASVEFVLIGGWAMAVHGRTRATDDIDVLVRPSAENAQRVFEALAAFGAPLSQHRVTPGLFEAASYGYRFGVKPNLVEVLTTISGVDYDTASKDVIEVNVDGRRVNVIGRAALMANKRAAARLKDLDDVEWLERNRG